MARSMEGKHGSYFEAVLQLRDVSQEVVDFAEDEIGRLKMHVADVITLKNGYDYKLSDNTLARRIGKNLQTKFGGKIEETSSLWGVKKDREVYRVTVLFRGVPFKKGEYSEELVANPWKASEGYYGILTLNKKWSKFDRYRVK